MKSLSFCQGLGSSLCLCLLALASASAFASSARGIGGKLNHSTLHFVFVFDNFCLRQLFQETKPRRNIQWLTMVDVHAPERKSSLLSIHIAYVYSVFMRCPSPATRTLKPQCLFTAALSSLDHSLAVQETVALNAVHILFDRRCNFSLIQLCLPWATAFSAWGRGWGPAPIGS